MNVIQKTFLRWALKAAGVYSATDSTLGEALSRLTGSRTYTGKNVDDQTAMQLSTVWGCNRIISETVGCLPGAIYESKGDGWVKTDHQLAQVLRNSPIRRSAV